MEHVANIAAGFAEMARLVRPGGLVYSCAQPLWESPYGHHMDCFRDHPWVHLVFSRPELADYARANGIQGERGHTIDAITKYMKDPANFNMRPAGDYLAACQRLPMLKILKNRLYWEDDSMLKHPLAQRAISAGFSPESLLAVRHLFVARKIS